MTVKTTHQDPEGLIQKLKTTFQNPDTGLEARKESENDLSGPGRFHLKSENNFLESENDLSGPGRFHLKSENNFSESRHWLGSQEQK